MKLNYYRLALATAVLLAEGVLCQAKTHVKTAPVKTAQESSDNDLFYELNSSDFVIRWAFQKVCDFVYDPRMTPWPTPTKTGKPATNFDPKAVKAGDMIFVRDAPYYFKHMHKKIEVPYFILTHGEYLDTFKQSYFKYLEDENILGWFTIHPPEQFHERVIPIALGIVQFNELYDNRQETHKKFLKYRRTKKEKLLYMNFTDWRNPKRKLIREFFITKPYCTTGDQGPFEKYMKETAAHKFSICPPGLGPDLYRIYECLLVGTIPVVKHTYMDPLYEGLPILFISDWEEVTEEFLNRKYAEITSRKYDPQKLYMKYWLNTIQAARDRLFARYRAEHELN